MNNISVQTRQLNALFQGICALPLLQMPDCINTFSIDTAEDFHVLDGPLFVIQKERYLYFCTFEQFVLGSTTGDFILIEADADTIVTAVETLLSESEGVIRYCMINSLVYSKETYGKSFCASDSA